jgi:hypothetical protein
VDIHHPYGALQRAWRVQRMRQFVERFDVKAETRVLDVGGDSFNWRLLADSGGVRPFVTILNLLPPDNAHLPEHLSWVVGSALTAPFQDGAFDVAFSNSVIEHLGSRAAQRHFALEVRRLAKRYWVQTPNRWFPIEPHLACPFIHYLPRSLQRPLYPFTPWAVFTPGITSSMMDAQFDSVLLLTKRDFGQLFPTATILTERVGGLAKCFIATSP